MEKVSVDSLSPFSRPLSVEIPEQKAISYMTGRGKIIWAAMGRGRGRDLNNNSSDPKVGGLQTTVTSPCKSVQWSPTGMRSGEASPASTYGEDMTCSNCSFCSRPAGNIVCRACGHTFQGRVRSRCAVHAEVIHLMDYEACPNCKAYQLKELVVIKSSTTSPMMSPVSPM